MSDLPDIAASERDYEAADNANEVVMALQMKARGSIGCCYYVAGQETLYFMEDLQLGNIEIVDQIKSFIEPTVVLISSRADESLINCFNPGASDGRASVDTPFDLPYLLELRPSKEFLYNQGKEKLLELRIGAQDGLRLQEIPSGHSVVAHPESSAGQGVASQQQRLLRLSSWVSTESILTVSCAGAILSYLQRRRASTYLPGDPQADALFSVSALTMFTLQGTMFINSDTLLSLQIMQSESHPSSHNQGPTKPSSGSKEGLSVYGLFHRLVGSSQGKYMLRQYFLRPSLNINLINERLDSVDSFARPDQSEWLRTTTKKLRSVGEARKLIIALRRGTLSPFGRPTRIAGSVWTGLRKFAFHALGIQQNAVEMAQTSAIPICTKIIANFDVATLKRVGCMVSEIVDFDESILKSRTVVRTGVDDDLDERKRLYEGIEGLLTEVAQDIAQGIPVGLPNELGVIYFPQIGFLIKMPKDEETNTSLWEGSEEDVWERMFSNDDKVYYKNQKMKDMDEHLGDIYTNICDREIEILHGLAQRVLEFEACLTTVSDICGELDCLLALAQGAKQNGFVRPRLTNENVIRIQAGRHPLQALTVSCFIPNDAYLVGGSSTVAGDLDDDPHTLDELRAVVNPSMIILTGPNYSGKSVYMKQVALITYLAHIGSFVPAESATIGLTDKILTRIATRESVTRAQSAFMVELQQVSMALNLASPRSLLLIDEFGKGTAAADGAGLACGLFKHLLDLQEKRPKVLAATHYHEIFENGFLETHSSLQFAHMEIQLTEEDESGKGVTYLYNLKLGRSLASFGTCCAALSGIDPGIVKRAEELVRLSIRGEDLVAACAILPTVEAKELGEAEQTARVFVAEEVHGDPRRLLAEALTRSSTD